jgi:hypothetical protein
MIISHTWGITMSKSQSELRWHLSRGDEPSRLITECELQLLAELGQLKETDLLWKPGLKGWQPADAIPGVLIPPALPKEGVEPTARLSRVPADSRRLDGALEIARAWTAKAAKHLSIFLRVRRPQFAASCRKLFELFQAHQRKANARLQQAIAGTKVLRWIDHRGGIAVLLGLTLLFGTLNFAMRGFAVEAEPVSKDFREASLVTRSGALSTCPQPKQSSEDDESTSKADIFAGFALLTESDAESGSVSNPVVAVPLPTRKPSKAGDERTATRAAREPKPMRFGTVGFAYDPQH